MSRRIIMSPTFPIGCIGSLARHLGALLMCTLCLCALPVRAAGHTDHLEDFVDGVVADAMYRERLAGVSVAIVGRDSVLLAKGYGIASSSPRTKMTADTLCRV